MESTIAYWLRWPSLEHFVVQYSWAWPFCEVVHFVGLCLLVGIVGMFDLRLLGMAKAVPVASLRRLLPWGVLGFVLCVASGAVFIGGFMGNVPTIHPYKALTTDIWLQLKLLFILLAGVNLLVFYVSGMSRAVDVLGSGEDAPVLAKLIAGTSLALWISIIIFGRLIPWSLSE
jgi:hypothetical protein